jgi:hypothetical protein
VITRRSIFASQFKDWRGNQFESPKVNEARARSCEPHSIIEDVTLL